ncbi:hypothetical protein BGW80DRAFT_1467817 [Lactifluus volemus]|nr:hypothetical protein BGW80DRAFT_1467817 [Lactifluus volemus]
MSQPAHPIVQVEDTGDQRIDTTGNSNIPRSEQRQQSQGQPTLSDGAEPIFNMYVKMSQEEDNKMADRWQKDADGILIFTGLFSAAVAALLAVSIQDLRPNPQDTAAFYLANIYQLLADPNISRASTLATPATPPPFSPPRYAIWVNSLWFLSLVISLTSALLATLLQQWARRYLTVTQPPRLSPHKRARIRSFFADGVEKFHLPLAVETLPTLLHVSLFLFFSGLLVFLFNINHTTFSIVSWWIGLSGGIYGCIALLPIFHHDSPYYAPLTFSTWFLLNGVRYEVFRILTFVTLSFDYFTRKTYRRFYAMREAYRKRTSWGIVKTAQEGASNMSAEIDDHVLKWTFEALDEDHELEQFIEAIPAFCTSQVVHEPRQMLANLDVLTAACEGFLIRTLSSRFLSERIKEKRFILCMQALNTLGRSFPSFQFLLQVFGPPAMDGVLQSVQIGHVLRRQCHSGDLKIPVSAQALVAGIIASVRERDGRWKVLVMDQLQISEDVLEDYLAHGDSVLLTNWIHITRQLFRFYYQFHWIPDLLGKIQSIISKFDIRNTLPGLQHDFCALWNKLRNKESSYLTNYVLKPNRHHFIALHQGTDAVPTAFDASTDDSDPILRWLPSYPLCNVLGHHSDGAIDDTTHSLIHPPGPNLDSIALATPDVPSLPAFNPAHSRIHLTEQVSLHGGPHATPIIQSPPVDIGNNDFVTTLPDPALSIATESHAAAPAISPIDNSESDTRPAMAASTAISPSFSSSGAVDRPYKIGDPRSVVPGIPPSSSPVAVSSDTLPADPLMSSARSPTSQIELIAPGSRLLTLGSIPEICFTSPQVTSDSQSLANLSENDATIDNSLATDLAQPEHLVDTTPPRDVDRAQ